MTAFTHRAAVLHACNAPLIVQQVPRKLPQSGQLLVKVKAAAINPSDWKMQQTKIESQLPCILGSDIAGTIEMIGSGTSSSSLFKIGDRVAAFAGGAWSGQIAQGGLQEYVLVQESNTMAMPDVMSFEEAATIPMALATAAGAIWHTLELPRSRLAFASNQAILIYGASSAVGLFAVQIVKILGLTVIAIATQKHEVYIKDLGADYYFDRHVADLPVIVSDLIKREGLNLELGVDAISDAATLSLSANILSECNSDGIAKLASTLDVPSKFSIPENVIVERTSASYFHTKEDNAQWLFHEYVKRALEAQEIRPAPPVRVVGGGLEAAQEALDICKKGVSCEKLVIQL